MFQQLVSELKQFLLPYEISVNDTSIFEELLLVSAGIQSQYQLIKNYLH